MTHRLRLGRLILALSVVLPASGPAFAGFQTSGSLYPPQQATTATCQALFGSSYRIADWNDIGNNLQLGADAIMAEDIDAYVTRDGQATYSSGRWYFVVRPTAHAVDPGFLVHAQYGTDFFLGSYSGDRRVLCFAQTAVSPPTISSFTASPSSIVAGQSASLSWSSTGGTSASLSGVGSVSTAGSHTVSPTVTTTYTLTVTGAGGTTTRHTTVSVSSHPGAAAFRTSSSLYAPQQATTATCQALFGSSYRIADWSDIGNNLQLGADAILAEDIDAYVTFGGQATSSPGLWYFVVRPISHAVDPGFNVYAQYGTDFFLGAWSGNRRVLCFASTASDPPPTISNLTANPASITRGQSSALSWSSTGGSSASISGVGTVPMSGSVSVSPSTTTTYTLTVNGSGGTTTRQTTVEVVPVTSNAVLSLGSVPLCSDQTATIPVWISNGSGTQSIEFDLVYDASKMTATGATAGSLTGGFSVSSNLSYGLIRVAMASGSSIGSSSGEVAKVTFRGEAGLSPGSSTSMSIQNVWVNDAAASGGSSTVTCVSPCRRGDVSGNGAVTAYDASMILQAVVGAITLDATRQQCADFNQNGTVTAYDASLVLQCVVTGTCP